MHFQEQQLQHNITKRMKLQEAIVATRSALASAKQINHQEEKHLPRNLTIPGKSVRFVAHFTPLLIAQVI